ncbi:MAG: Sec-independent protein translocase protein TatA [Candidatus Collierbacteria bacterium GW2011_GWC1_45_47]|uniref:Sec-independent protein translocase protein TatA n=3 Tax=Candidatus Collieribacteriota TaxID=1752725 RepID=A0A0G1KDI5_9BACT|nr:MAG: Sec-independent protein translocase protein TatA [Candidatus Collierbacteria bacterium GW2011_GWA1_44_12]KKT37771.1 MAG: Sec-independent protein translocase protein TatA [Candidatus Collierbacteria bacterium GW2011_GWF1_44_12]KKT45899.1 MAG: Sec-independent protein translocase protein TatA [Candidatus Collierbacteria bacterium GW2011_GWF2_44_15]KKU08812.1 MAG: Sec-independent protein translocase protein TatA [Candidatus Collierbacteria bacterium GW2011_GWC1_45_47]
MFSNIGIGEVVVVVLVLLFLFGGKKLPELARGLGESGKELKKAKKEIERALSDINSDIDEDPKTKGGDQQ